MGETAGVKGIHVGDTVGNVGVPSGSFFVAFRQYAGTTQKRLFAEVSNDPCYRAKKEALRPLMNNVNEPDYSYAALA
jgi:hypothetical protein